MAVTQVNPLEHLLGGQSFLRFILIAEGTVGAGWLERLLVENLRNHKRFDFAVPIDEPHLLSNEKI
jgi:hypothetical protein